MSDERKEAPAPADAAGGAIPGSGPDGGPAGGPGSPGKAPNRGRRIFHAGAAAAALLAAATAAFFTVPAFHAVLHPHPADNTAKSAGASAKYTCGMHPFIISDAPGTCPVCGMALTRIDEAAAASPADGGVAGTGPVEGYSTVRAGEEGMRVAGVLTAPAVRGTIVRSVRTVGIVVPDETRVRRVQTKTEGWIEKLHVGFTGQGVTRGQPLLDVYSPDLVASQKEYLLALGMQRRMKENPYPEQREMAEQLVESSRRRLALFDVPEAFIAELERTGELRRTVTLNAPFSGYVTAKGVYEGMKVGPGTELLTVTDLSRVWIEADLFEYEAASVRVGQDAVLSSASDAGLRLKGRVAYVYPTLSPETRTLKVRFEFANPGLRLKPQAYADVSLGLESGSGVVIPDSALIETGVRRIVFVDRGGGTFEPREVTVGVRGDGKAQVLSGLTAGERVAVQANFLLDSESKLQAALTRMTGSGSPQPSPAPPSTSSPAPQSTPPGNHAGHGGGR